MKRNRGIFLKLRWLAYLIFAVFAFLYLYPFMRILPKVTDEGTLIQGAVRVAEGQIPFRDFFEVMGPGTFYWLALFFKVLGVTWFATRISLMLTTLSTALLIYFLSRRLHVCFESTPAILFAATSFGLLWPAISHHGDSNLFALLAFAVLLYWLESRRPLFLILVGVLAGITTCFLQPKGVLLFVSFVLVLWVLMRNEARLWPSIGLLTAGYCAVAVFVLLFFSYTDALPDVIYANVTWPLTRYRNTNSVPYGMGLFSFYWQRWTVSLNQALPPAAGYLISSIVLIPFLLVVALPFLLAAFALRSRTVAFTRATLPYWVAGCALWASEIHRKDVMHLVYGSPLLIILCLHLYGSVASKWSRQAIRAVVVCSAALALFNWCAVSTAQTRISTRRGVGYSYRDDAVLEYLNTRIRPGEEIFAYPYRPIYYFLLSARNATRYSFFTYGLNTDLQFREAIDALETKKVQHVIWDTSADDTSMDWAFPNRPKARQIMEPYLIEHYRTIYFRDGVRLLERTPNR